ncbi:MAG: helix-turn-helix transcriptional regulator [Desulfobaccales bacterium]
MAATPFKLERVKRELTQVELAALSGIPQHRISLLERGVKPRADEVKALARAFKVDPEELQSA